MVTKLKHALRLSLVLVTASTWPALGALPDAIALKPYQTAASAAFKDCISFQEIPGKPGQFLVTQKNGVLINYNPSSGVTSTWAQISVSARSEEGSYTVAFHPDFQKNGRYFVLHNPMSDLTVPGLFYGHPGQFREVLEEYTADVTHEKDSGLPPKLVKEFCCKDGPGHNGMYAVFAKDGMLFLSIGDGNSDGRETQSRHAWPES